jgi:hypothetical protein
MPSGKTGNEWSNQDFSSGDSPLVKIGAPEFADFCISRKTCELTGDVLEKFKDIIRRFATDDEDDDSDDEDYDPQSHFAVLVRERLVEAGLLPKNDPDRYQYKLSMGFIHYAE